MKLTNGGPRFDASCLSILVGSESRIVMAGGWNNTGMVVSEYYDEKSQIWKIMGKNDGNSNSFMHVLYVQLKMSCRFYSTKMKKLKSMGEVYTYHAGPWQLDIFRPAKFGKNIPPPAPPCNLLAHKLTHF